MMNKEEISTSAKQNNQGLPTGWIIELFGNLADFKNGLNYSKENDGKGLKIIGVGDFQREFSIGYENLSEVSGFENIDKSYLLKNDDIIFVRSNGNKALVGRALYICNLEERVSHSGFTIRARINSDTILPIYAALQFQTENTRRHLLLESGGSNISNLSQGMLANLSIPLPPLPEQRAIAAVLGTWDKGIDTLQRLIAAKQRHKKALMQQLLTGKKRFAEFGKPWQEVQLGDIFKRVTRKNTENNTNVLTISAQRGLINQEHYFNKQVASEILDNYFLLKKGEFAYNKSYSNGYPMGAIKRLKDYDAGVVTTLYICFALKDAKKNSADFMEQYFNAGFLNRGLKEIAHEGGRAHGLLNVTPTDYFNLTLKVPAFSEQQKIATALQAADRELGTMERKLAALQAQKKGLMQQLLTGKVRVKAKETAL